MKNKRPLTEAEQETVLRYLQDALWFAETAVSRARYKTENPADREKITYFEGQAAGVFSKIEWMSRRPLCPSQVKAQADLGKWEKVMDLALAPQVYGAILANAEDLEIPLEWLEEYERGIMLKMNEWQSGRWVAEPSKGGSK
jgi:hypothetical protein